MTVTWAHPSPAPGLSPTSAVEWEVTGRRPHRRNEKKPYAQQVCHRSGEHAGPCQAPFSQAKLRKRQIKPRKKRFVFTSFTMVYQSMNLAQPLQLTLIWTSIHADLQHPQPIPAKILGLH